MYRVQLAGRCCSPQSQHVSPTTHGLSWRISSSSPAAPLATRRARRPPAPARAPPNPLDHHTAGACQRCMAPAQLRRPPSGTSCAWRTTPRRPRCSCGGSHQPMSCGFCIQRPALAPTSECAGQRQRLTRASRSQRSARTERWASSRHAACVSLMSRRELSSKRQRARTSECRSLARTRIGHRGYWIYTYGRVLRTQEPGSQPQVLSQLLSGLTASLRFLSGGRPPALTASLRFLARGGERETESTCNATSLIQQRQFVSRGGRSAPCAPVATLEQTL